jgi:hypothetical protein
MEPQSATMPVVRPRLRRRWWSTGAKIVLGVAVVGVLAFAGFWWWSQRRLEAAWNEAVKEAELDLPRWRLMELEEDRPKIPDAENSALHIIALRDKGGQVAVAGAADYDSIFGKLRPTVQLNDQQADLIRQELKRIAKPLEEARRLKDMPRGRFPITYSDDGIKTPLTEHAGLRQIGDWLQHDAMLLADEGKIDLAIESCQAMVHAGRAMEGDLFFICFSACSLRARRPRRPCRRCKRHSKGTSKLPDGSRSSAASGRCAITCSRMSGSARPT